MKHESKSATNRICSILFLLSCTGLTACADIKGPTWLTGEPDDTVLAAPRVVGVPSRANEKLWPNLAEVPDTKPDFSALASRKDETRTMKSDNLKAQAEMERIRNIQLEEETRMRTSTMESDLPVSSSLKP